MQNNSSDDSKADKREKTNGQFTSWIQSLFQIGSGRFFITHRYKCLLYYCDRHRDLDGGCIF